MSRVVVAAGILALSASQIFFTDTVGIVFEVDKLPPEVTWSDQMELTPAGLATRGPGVPNTSRNFWLRTQPMSAGPSWRPPRIANVTVTLTAPAFAGQANGGFVRAWSRYGADRVHWSSWFPLPATESTLAATEFKGVMTKPYFAPSRYEDLMSAWWQTSPVWSSDEHEYCRWLAANHRDVFESEIPFMGYVQVLIEGNAQGFSLKGLSISIGSSGSGFSSNPSGPKRAGADGKWFFELPNKK